MTLKDYIFKRKCILQCSKILPTLRSTSKEFLHEQMKRMNEELNQFHIKNKKRKKK